MMQAFPYTWCRGTKKDKKATENPRDFRRGAFRSIYPCPLMLSIALAGTADTFTCSNNLLHLLTTYL
jgi:hypothetical protein